MKTIKIIGIVLGAIIVLFLVIGIFLPKRVHLEESIEIKAPSTIVFNQVSNFNNWAKWSPFQDSLSDMKTIIRDPAEGVGAIMKWESKKDGNGSLTFIEVLPDSNIKAELNFEDNSRSIVTCDFKQIQDGTKVVWGMDVEDLSYPFGKWFGLFMGKMMHSDFQKGLNSLKLLCESGKAMLSEKWKTSEVIEKEVSPMMALTIKDSSTVDGFSQKFEEIYSLIGIYMKKMKIKQTAAPFCIYHTWNPNGLTVIEAGIPIDKKISGKDRILFSELPGGKVVMASQFGSYESSGNAHNAIEKYMKEKNIICNGAPWEVYVTDPTTEPDTANWETQIYYPVK